MLRVAVSQAACSIAFRFHLVGERTDAAKDYEKATGSIYLSREGEEESEVDDLWSMVESLMHSPFCQGLSGEWMLLLPGLTRRVRRWASRHRKRVLNVDLSALPHPAITVLNNSSVKDVSRSSRYGRSSRVGQTPFTGGKLSGQPIGKGVRWRQGHDWLVLRNSASAQTIQKNSARACYSRSTEHTYDASLRPGSQ